MHKSDLAGRLEGRPPAVEFIDGHLAQHDPAFLNSLSAFDNLLGRYVPLLPQHQTAAGQSASTNSEVRHQTFPGQDAVPWETYQDVEAQSMRFWNDIFPEAVAILFVESEEPKILTKSGAGIRNASGWVEVCHRLNEAKTTYTGEEGTAGTLKRMRRKVADNFSQPAAHVAKMVPDIDLWTTPVVGTIGLLLQAVSTAAKIRQEVLTSLSDLQKTFSYINDFAATFPKDQNIRQASVSLVVAIFQAVEQAMAFFFKSSGRKVADAIFSGCDYQKELLNSFTEVQKRSDHLLQKAQNSHYEENRARENQLLAGQAKHSADVKNMFLSLLHVYNRDWNRHIEESRRRDEVWKQHQDAQHERRHQEVLARLQQFQMIPRPVSPLPVTLAFPPPPPLYEHTAAIPQISIWTAQILLQLLGVRDISTSDLLRVKDLDSTLSQKDKSKADQVVQMQLFERWMTSLKPAKLLIHGDFRESGTASPLSLLTATMTEAVPTDQFRFVTLLFFCACHLDPEEDEFTGGRALIQALISQLLQQQPHMTISPSPWELHPDLVRQGDLRQLCQLFSLLVHGLPREVTLFCFVDGMAFYERDEFVDETQFVMTEVLRLVGNPAVQANVKLLITSPWRTDIAHQFFDEDDEIIYTEAILPAELTPSSSQVIKHYMSDSDSDSNRESSPERW